MDALDITDLDKVYDDGTKALAGLSLSVSDGGFHGLLGPNGSGKSTLIGIITGLVRGPAGHVRVFGHDAVADPRRARTLVGLAPQEVHLDRFLTAREVLSYHGRYFGMQKADAEARADELLEAFDLQGKAGTRPHRLSGGMRRRLLIARALVHRPRRLKIFSRFGKGHETAQHQSRQCLHRLGQGQNFLWRYAGLGEPPVNIDLQTNLQWR